jgi:threonine synthase
MDPHTAIAYSVWERYLKDSGDNVPALIASTASPFKFSGKVLASIGEDGYKDEFEGMKRLGDLMGIPVPERMSELEKLPIRHSKVCEKSRMRDAVKSFLEGSKTNG